MTAKPAQPIPSSDEMWAIMKEISARQKVTAEQMREIVRRFDEKFAEIDRRIDEKFAETDRELKETGKLLKEARNFFTSEWGMLMESLVEGELIKLFHQRGIGLERTSESEKGEMCYTDQHGNEQKIHCEIDIIAKNSEEIVVVDVKTTLRVQDVDKFLGILQKFPQLLPEYKGKKMYGAMAYLQSQGCSEVYAEKHGLFVLKATGDSSSIINGEGFQAKDFG